MAKKYAFLFPGQGAQFQGMVKDIAETFPESKKVIDDISEITREDITKLLWDTDITELSRSDRSQLAITAASITVITALQVKGIKPSAVMGFSLGEFPALYTAGVLSLEDVVSVVKKRGQIMQNVCDKIAAESEGNVPGMAAVIGLPPEKVIEIAKSCSGTYAANLNSPVQTVVSGIADGLAEAEAKCKEAGARRFIRLAVAGPFHSPLMHQAADEFEKVIADVAFNDPKLPLFSNVTGKKVKSGSEAKKAAVLHLTHPVQWTNEESVLSGIIENDTGNEWSLIEPGPGRVLSGLWAKSGIETDIKCSPCGTAEQIAAL